MKIKPKYITHEEFKAELMKDPEFVREYEKQQPEFEIARQLIEARIEKKMTQQEIAKRAGTGQAVISRMESANGSPSVDLLKRLAEALGKRLVIQFK